jgi:mannitol/fructose-specific phosphotransferase system IIA component (Ntr-type)
VRVKLAKAFGPNSIAVTGELIDFVEAVATATAMLEIDGKATAGYSLAVQQSLHELGPYFVVAPGIALAHAAPSHEVIEVGFSLLKLTEGTASGSQNDPVHLLFAFCSPTPNDHIELLGEFARVIGEPGKVNLLLNASAESVIRSLLA